MMDEKELFYFSCLDLEEKVKNANHYQILRAAGIMRQLLLDRNSLLAVVNREYRMKFVFEMSRPIENIEEFSANLEKNGKALFKEKKLRRAPDPGFYYHWPKPVSGNGILLSKNQFLNYVVVVSSANTILKVKDLIRLKSNTFGGVHFDKASWELANLKSLYGLNTRIVETIDDPMNFLTMTSYFFRDIVEIFLRSIRHLLKEIKEELVERNEGI